MAGSDSQIDKPQHGRPKRAELPDVNINRDTRKALILRVSLNWITHACKLFPFHCANLVRLGVLKKADYRLCSRRIVSILRHEGELL